MMLLLTAAALGLGTQILTAAAGVTTCLVAVNTALDMIQKARALKGDK